LGVVLDLTKEWSNSLLFKKNLGGGGQLKLFSSEVWFSNLNQV
jgi:hypothetical protein